MEKRENYFRELFETARKENLILKYIASFDNGKASVGLQTIDEKHNFANLSGKDNAVLFYTNRYADLPLVVKGAGAGADVTAAGVLQILFGRREFGRKSNFAHLAHARVSASFTNPKVPFRFPEKSARKSS